ISSTSFIHLFSLLYLIFTEISVIRNEFSRLEQRKSGDISNISSEENPDRGKKNIGGYYTMVGTTEIDYCQ
ncbi:hypothetical protein, partial [Listeria monocytogenes]|uniref:hypothetical protein n=1 Tax=Listeria monocytogenes TaxID=1639 RepID=UPI001C7D118C